MAATYTVATAGNNHHSNSLHLYQVRSPIVNFLQKGATRTDSECRIVMSFVLDLYLIGVPWLHVLLAPYTKVEESFNLHAIHDVLMYGVKPDALQHVRALLSHALLGDNLNPRSMITACSLVLFRAPS